jgi:hypothetical protein
MDRVVQSTLPSKHVSLKLAKQNILLALCTFLVEIWSWLDETLHFILSFEAGFYKPTVLKVHFAGL